MPTILRIKGLRFHFYSDEGTEPAHIHIRSAEGECKFCSHRYLSRETEAFLCIS